MGITRGGDYLGREELQGLDFSRVQGLGPYRVLPRAAQAEDCTIQWAGPRSETPAAAAQAPTQVPSTDSPQGAPSRAALRRADSAQRLLPQQCSGWQQASQDAALEPETDVSLNNAPAAHNFQRRTHSDPESAELQAFWAWQRAVAGMQTREPPAALVHAATIPADSAFWREYPQFTAPFVAGQLKGMGAVWRQVFSEEGEQLEAKVSKWLDDGYSTWFDKDRLRGKQPRELRHDLQEEAWAVQHVCDTLLPIGAVEEVRRETLPTHTIVCNFVIARDKRGQLSRFCWSGRPMNKAVDDKKFKMEVWATISRLVRPGDWVFSLDFKKGYFQVKSRSRSHRRRQCSRPLCEKF